MHFMGIDVRDLAGLPGELDDAAISDAKLGLLALRRPVPDRHDIRLAELRIEQETECRGRRNLAVDEPGVVFQHVRFLHQQIDQVALEALRRNVVRQRAEQRRRSRFIAHHLRGIGFDRRAARLVRSGAFDLFHAANSSLPIRLTRSTRNSVSPTE